MQCKRCRSENKTDASVCQTCGRLYDAGSTWRESSGEETRAQVLEVVVRQALSNPDWRKLCDLAMQVNNISVAQVQDEAGKRGAQILPPNMPGAARTESPASLTSKKSDDDASGKSGDDTSTTPISAVNRLQELHARLVAVSQQNDGLDSLQQELTKLAAECQNCILSVQSELRFHATNSVTSGVEQELQRTTGQPLNPPNKKDDPHRVDWNKPLGF